MSFRLPPKVLRSDIADAFRRDFDKAVADKGKISRDDVASLFDRVYDKKTDKVDHKAAEALAYVSQEYEGKMDAGAKEVAHKFIQAYYTDAMSGVTEEYRRQVEQQLAQDKRDFTEFLVRDKKEHKSQTLEEFKEDLKENRIETSEWQSLMLWLQTGTKKNPYTS